MSTIKQQPLIVQKYQQDANDANVYQILFYIKPKLQLKDLHINSKIINPENLIHKGESVVRFQYSEEYLTDKKKESEDNQQQQDDVNKENNAENKYQLLLNIPGKVIELNKEIIEVVDENSARINLDGINQKLLKSRGKSFTLNFMKIRICDHVEFEDEVFALTQQNDFPLQCQNCQEQQSFIYLKKAEPLYLRNLSDKVNLENNQFLRLEKPKINQNLKVSQVIGRVVQIIKEDGEEEEEFLYNLCLNKISGKLVQFTSFEQPGKDDPILFIKPIICSHYNIDVDNNCLKCGKKVTDDQNYQVYKRLSNFTRFYKPYVEKQSHLFREILVKQEKLILILDLDNTILHAVIKDARIRLPERADIFKMPMDGRSSFYIKIRDYIEVFFEEILEHFELYVFTKATKNYALEVCRYFHWRFPQFVEKYPSFFSFDNIIAMEDYDDAERKINKNLSYILPNCDELMLILDDRKDVWGSHSKNIFHTLPFYYWRDEKFWYELQKQESSQQKKNEQLEKQKQKEEEQKATKNQNETNDQGTNKQNNITNKIAPNKPKLDVKQEFDCFLLYAKDILIDLKKKFYNGHTKDIRTLYSQYKKNLFLQKNMVLYQLQIDKKKTEQETYEYIRCTQMGAQITELVNQDTFCIIARQIPVQAMELLSIKKQIVKKLLKESGQQDLINQAQNIQDENDKILYRNYILKNDIISKVNQEKLNEELQKLKKPDNLSSILFNAIKFNIPILHHSWVYFSYEFNYLLDLEMFDLTKIHAKVACDANFMTINIASKYKNLEQVNQKIQYYKELLAINMDEKERKTKKIDENSKTDGKEQNVQIQDKTIDVENKKQEQQQLQEQEQDLKQEQKNKVIDENQKDIQNEKQIEQE